MRNAKIMLLVLITVLATLVGCEKNPTDQYYVTIILDYEEVFLTSNTPMNVYVDDTKLGRQEAGSEVSYEVSLEEGTHEFYLKNDGIYKTDKLTFEVLKNDQSFKFGAKTRMTFGVEIWNK